MVKLLHDMCLNCIRNNLDTIPDVGRRLPRILKENILNKLSDHDMFTPAYLPVIEKHLFVPELKHIAFYECDQITDSVLKQIAATGCKLQSLMINGCKKITGRAIDMY